MQIQTENFERQLNYLSDQIASSVGMPPIGPRYPARSAPNVIGSVTLNNIKVTGGNVGSINTGNIGKLDITISAIKNNGNANIADAISRLSEAVLTSTTITEDQKNEIVEILSGISNEIATPPEHRRVSIAKTLLTRLQELFSSTSDLTTIWQQWGSVITGFFDS